MSTTAKKSTAKTAIVVPELEIAEVPLVLIGESSLIVNRFSEKAKEMMRQAQQGAARMKKPPKDPEADFKGSLYINDKGEYYFPCIAFKAAVISACRQVEGVSMTAAKQLLHIKGEEALIMGSEPTIREDMVRVGMGTADIRYRGEFKDWWTKITVVHDTNCISTSEIFNLFKIAGFGVGIGEWRPSAPKNSGPYGRFRVATAKDLEERGLV